jgi:hypothetical protein
MWDSDDLDTAWYFGHEAVVPRVSIADRAYDNGNDAEAREIFAEL